MRLIPLKLFKKLRLIDYLIILIVLFFVYIIFNFFYPQEKWITVVILDENVPIYHAGSLKIGDTESGPNGKVTAQLQSLNRIDSEEKFDRTLISLTPLPEDVFVTARLLVSINSRTRGYEYKNQELFVGKGIELRFKSGVVRGNIRQIEGINQLPPFKTKEITVTILDQPQWLADSIVIGALEKDENGQNIVEVLTKDVSISPNNSFTDTSINKKVDINLKLKVTGVELQGQFIVRNNMELLIGNKFTFKANNTLVKDVLITNIK